MKQVADSRPVRTVRWLTQAVDESLRQFQCRSNVLVVLNDIPTNDADVAAILDRLDVVYFDPTKAEIIEKMRTFDGVDQADVDLLAETPCLPSLRTLRHFQGWKKSELDEMEELYSECGVPRDIQVMINLKLTFPKTEWRSRFANETGRSKEAAKKYWQRNEQAVDQLIEARTNLAAA